MCKKSQAQQRIPSIFKHWHGIVQMLTALVTLGLIILLVCAVYLNILHVCDAILLGGTLLTIAAAVICSHAYNYQPGSAPANSLQEKAAKLQATWLHANYCWQAINVWMTITPLYCTCATIYISGICIIEDNQLRILVYSIISLVLSLGIYVIRPSAQGEGYQKAYLSITTALTKMHGTGTEEELIVAINKGEEAIGKQNLFNPQ